MKTSRMYYFLQETIDLSNIAITIMETFACIIFKGQEYLFKYTAVIGCILRSLAGRKRRLNWVVLLVISQNPRSRITAGAAV